MPLGNTSYLQIETMAENDNNKYLIFNDAIQALDDAFNRILAVDTTSSNVTLLESELTRYVFFDCSGHTASRTLFVPITVGASPVVVVNRTMYVRNGGTQPLTIDHVGSPGTNVVLNANETALIFANGTDIISVATGSGGSGGATDYLGLTDTPGSYSGQTLRLTRVNAGETALEFVDPTFLLLNDTPASYASAGGFSTRVNGAGTALEFVDEPVTPTLGTALQVLRVNAAGTDLEFATPSTGVTTFAALTDTPANFTGAAGQQVRVNSGETALEYVTDPLPTFTTGDALKVVRVNAGETAYELVTPTGGGSSDFTSLTDTPANYTGASLQVVRVNAAETGLEFATVAASVPVQDDGVQVVASPTALNFTGNVQVTDNSGVADINIPGGLAFEWSSIAVTNGDFETGNLTGWTIDSGTPVVEDPSVSYGAVTTAANGSFIVDGGAQAVTEFHQDITISGAKDAVYFAVGAELLKDFNDDDSAQIIAEVRDGSSNVLASASAISNAGPSNVPVTVYVPSHINQVTLRIRVRLNRNSGSNLNAGIDNVTLSEYIPTISRLRIVEDTSTNRVTTDADFDGRTIIEMNNASANTFTVNNTVSATEPVTIVQKGGGQTTIVAGPGVTISSAGGLLASSTQFSHMVLTPRGSNTYYLAGDLA